MQFDNKVIWITGASSGIGEALARALLQQGARVILSGRRAQALQAVAAQAPERSLVLPFESTDYPALAEVVAQAWNWQGHIDCLINNAGISQRSLALDTNMEVYRTIMEVDYLAPVALTQLLLPRMVERGSGQLAVVSSVAGKVGAPLRTAYCGAKHAVIGYFEALRAEVEQAHGIAVSVILPGSVKTGVATNALGGDGQRRGRSDVNIDNGMSAAEAAQQIIAGLAAGQRTIEVVEGMEKMALQLRTADPERLFSITAAEGARLAQERAAHGSADIDPGNVQRLDS
ncbi:Short-chain dehydrogenase [Pseudomonas pohangensis]|uniref:Short-chain dehydrogenase n=1 Tax=Pseudomonas pohangensis TaxID=364197 RepID=A0A1H2FUB7_9PSED|nr:SDR family NAD(P)-dependent oxidoreductase [Pseudomonas pohangensis]SDU10911.1 Short-chain dehydrogenase [Pseudomonas pohangensis]